MLRSHMALPRHVRAYRRRGSIAGFRAVVAIGEGRRWYGPLRTDPAEAAADAARHLAVSGRHASGVTLGRAIELVVLELDRTGARPATEVFYRAHYRALAAYLGSDRPLASLTPGDVYDFADSRRGDGVSMSTVWGHDVPVLRRMISVCLKRGLLRDDPIAGVDRPRVRQARFPAFTSERIADICRQIRASGHPAAERDALAVELLFGTGLRRSEVGRLRRCDVDLETRLMHVDGKNAQRTLPIEGIGLQALTALCAGKRGQDRVGPSAEALTSTFWRWKERLGIAGFSPHAMRHSFATDAVRRGVSPFVLASLLGHRTLRQTMRYYTSSGDDVRRAMRAIGGHATPE